MSCHAMSCHAACGTCRVHRGLFQILAHSVLQIANLRSEPVLIGGMLLLKHLDPLLEWEGGKDTVGESVSELDLGVAESTAHYHTNATTFS